MYVYARILKGLNEGEAYTETYRTENNCISKTLAKILCELSGLSNIYHVIIIILANLMYWYIQ